MIRRQAGLGLAFLCACMGLWNLAVNAGEARYVRAIARLAVAEAGATTDRDRVIALRDYLRRNVERVELQAGVRRPFLRDSGAETLRSGRGFCGEVSRAFIVMASELGIRAKRVNLHGKKSHVVAEAEVEPRRYLVVDSQFPPQIADLEILDRVMLRPEYTESSTLNLRRFHLERLLPRMTLEAGPIPYWQERPDLIKATVWFGLALLLVAARLLLPFARRAPSRPA